MKRNTIYLSVFCIALFMILICVPVMVEGGGGGDGSGMGDGGNTDISSILAGLSEIKFIIGGLAALSGLILLKTIKINRNIRTLLMCAVFVLFGVLVIMHQPSPLRAVVDPATALATGSAITRLRKLRCLLLSAACRSSERNCFAGGSARLGHYKRS